jgi:Flp pilus assembly protein TadG
MPTSRFNIVRRWFRGYVTARDGVAAIEFAIVSIPFLVLLFSILELGILFMASTAIEAAATNAARQIRTGQLQQSSANNAGGFRNLVCADMSWISAADCNANLSVDVRTFSSFSAMNVTPPVSGAAIDASQLTFNDGAPCDIVLVRVFYPWTLLTPLIEPGLPNLGPNQRLLATAIAFRNENYQSQGATCS